MAEIFLDHGERQVDASADAGRGPDPPVLDKDRIRLDANFWKAVRQSWTVAPMRRGALAVQGAGPGQRERSETNGRPPPSRGQHLRNPLHQDGVLPQRP